MVEATTTSDATPSIYGVSGGLAAVAAMFSDSSIEGVTRSHVGGDTSVDANRLEIHATDTSGVHSSTLVVGIGGVTGAGARSTGTITRTTEAFVDSGSQLSLGAATLDIDAISKSTADGWATGVAAGGIAVAVLDVESTTDATTRAYVGSGASIDAGGLDLKADAVSLAKSPSTVVGVGLLAGAGIQLDAVDSSTVEAFIGPEAGYQAGDDVTRITVTGGDVNVTAKNDSEAKAETSVVTIADRCGGFEGEEPLRCQYPRLPRGPGGNHGTRRYGDIHRGRRCGIDRLRHGPERRPCGRLLRQYCCRGRSRCRRLYSVGRGDYRR